MKKEILDEEKILVIPEDRLDLIVIYYLLKNKITKIITKVYWQEKNISQTRTVRLGRKPVNILLEPEDIRFDHSMRSMRITGKVLEALPEEEVKGRKLGVDINIGSIIYLEKEARVLNILDIIKTQEYKQFIIIVVDSGAITLARVADVITVLDETYIPSSKFYSINFEALSNILRKTFKKIEEMKKQEEDLIIIAAVNIFTKKYIEKYKKLIDIVIEGDFSGTYTGVIQVLRDTRLRKAKINNPVLNNIDTYEKLFKNIYHRRIIYGIEDIKNAILSRNITILYVNYQVILSNPELIEYIIRCLERKIKVIISDKQDFLGIAIEKFGGIVGIY